VFEKPEEDDSSSVTSEAIALVSEEEEEREEEGEPSDAEEAVSITEVAETEGQDEGGSHSVLVRSTGSEDDDEEEVIGIAQSEKEDGLTGGDAAISSDAPEKMESENSIEEASSGSDSDSGAADESESEEAASEESNLEHDIVAKDSEGEGSSSADTSEMESEKEGEETESTETEEDDDEEEESSESEVETTDASDDDVSNNISTQHENEPESEDAESEATLVEEEDEERERVNEDESERESEEESTDENIMENVEDSDQLDDASAASSILMQSSEDAERRDDDMPVESIPGDGDIPDDTHQEPDSTEATTAIAEVVDTATVETREAQEKEDTTSIFEPKADDYSSKITVSVVTWNLAEMAPSEDEARFIRRFRKAHPDLPSEGSNGSDIVMIGGQETENTKPRRAEGSRSRELRRLMVKMLGRKYVPIAIHSLGGVQFGLFVRREILDEIEFCRVADVACGVGNVFHNKGAICAFLQMKARQPAAEVDGRPSSKRRKSVKMLFLTAHMAAHVKNVDARNEDFWRIASELEAQAPPRFLRPKTAREQALADAEGSGGSYLMDSMDHVFFCGDLNYRLDLPRELTEYTVMRIAECLETNDRRQADDLRLSLLRHDQLTRVISEGAAFPGFAEGKINFAPTFKFDKGTKSYDTSHKQRIPAWTDRILFKPSGVRVLDYRSEVDATHSDHRPVSGTFLVDIKGSELPDRPRSKPKRRSRRNNPRPFEAQ